MSCLGHVLSTPTPPLTDPRSPIMRHIAQAVRLHTVIRYTPKTTHHQITKNQSPNPPIGKQSAHTAGETREARPFHEQYKGRLPFLSRENFSLRTFLGHTFAQLLVFKQRLPGANLADICRSAAPVLSLLFPHPSVPKPVYFISPYFRFFCQWKNTRTFFFAVIPLPCISC